MEILGTQARIGAVEQAAAVDVGQTAGAVIIRPDAAFLKSLTDPLCLAINVEQSEDDGATWFPLVGCESFDLLEDCSGVNRDGSPRDGLKLTWTEQVIRGDVLDRFGWATKREVPTDNGKNTYHQLAMLPTVRVRVDACLYQWFLDGLPMKSYAETVAAFDLLLAARKDIDTPKPLITRKRIGDAELLYKADVLTGDILPSPVLLGRQSASLLGIFTGATAAAATATTSSRTTTAGSLITGTFAAFRAVAAPTSVATTDNKTNAFTDVERLVQGSLVRISIAYNIPSGGNRAAGHTETGTATGGTGGSQCSMGGQEWDGVASSPTIVSTTAAATSAAASTGTVAVSAASLAVGLVAYDGGTTTITPNGSTQAQEVDESSSAQDQNCSYKVAQTGSPSVAWTLGASRDYGAVIICFTESVATATLPAPVIITKQAVQRASSW